MLRCITRRPQIAKTSKEQFGFLMARDKLKQMGDKPCGLPLLLLSCEPFQSHVSLPGFQQTKTYRISLLWGKYVDFAGQNYSVPVKTKSLSAANSGVHSGVCSSTYGEQEKMEVGRGIGLLNDTSEPACCVQGAGFVDSSKPRTVIQQAPM